MNANAPFVALPLRVNNGFVPCEGPKDVPLLIDFSLGAIFTLDMSLLQAQGFISGVQTIFVDNSENSNSLEITSSPATNQEITVPPNSQGYFPILQTNPPQLTFNSGAFSGKIMVQLLNFYIAPCVWGTSSIVGGTVAVSDAILDATVTNNQVATVTNPNNPTLVDRSGTITAGGTAQQIAAANSTRKKLIVSNPITATENLLLSFNSGATGAISLAPGATYIADGISVETNSVWVNAATTAHAFTAWEG